MLAAWDEWRSSVDFENLDYGSHRLLPLLHLNLLRHQAPVHPWFGRMKGLHRHSWVQNQRLFARVANLVREFHEELGTPAMLLKGAALAMHVYPDPGLRPMHDCDLLVPLPAVPAAMTLLERRGWRPVKNWAETGRPMANMTALRRRLTHAQHFVANDSDPSRKAADIDLHWFALEDAGNNNDLNTDLWSRALTVALPDGTPVLIPDSTDLLAHVCLHGLRTNDLPPVRWVADAVLLLRSSTAGGEVTLPIDWQRLQGLAVQRALTLRLTAALAILADTTGVQVPSEVLTRLRSETISREERTEFRSVVKGEHYLKAGFRGRFAWEINRTRLYRLRSPDDDLGRSRLGRLWNAATYFCGRWFVHYPGCLPSAAARYSARWVSRRLPWKLRSGQKDT